jgi:hypothetical protein
MDEEIKQYIPLDKSWAIRLGFLDIINGTDLFLSQIKERDDLNNDINDLIKASEQWNDSDEIDIGESGTLFRYLQFASWKLGLNKKFVKHKTLLSREMCNDSNIVNWPLDEIAKLDHNTTQWASAAILMGNTDEVPEDNYFLQMSKEALKHYLEIKNKRDDSLCEIKTDKTFLRQIEYFVNLLEGKQDIKFKMIHPDDYCFARAFDLTNKKEGKEMWPAVIGHESNRLEEMEIALEQFEKGEAVTSTDHRVAQSLALLGLLKNKEISFSSPDCVNKTWPRFWEFLDFVSKNK